MNPKQTPVNPKQKVMIPKQKVMNPKQKVLNSKQTVMKSKHQIMSSFLFSHNKYDMNIYIYNIFIYIHIPQVVRRRAVRRQQRKEGHQSRSQTLNPIIDSPLKMCRMHRSRSRGDQSTSTNTALVIATIPSDLAPVSSFRNERGRRGRGRRHS